MRCYKSSAGGGGGGRGRGRRERGAVRLRLEWLPNEERQKCTALLTTQRLG